MKIVPVRQKFCGGYKDYHQILLGQCSYGKGTAQSIFPFLMEIILNSLPPFYSPLGYTINGIGVEPDLPLKSLDMIKAALLLLSDPPDGGAGSVELLANGHIFIIALALARSSEYWEVWGEVKGLLQYLPAYKAPGEADYSLSTSQQFQNQAGWYYPQASRAGSLDNYDNKQELLLYISPSWELTGAASASPCRFRCRAAI